MSTPETLERTPLYDQHLAHGARMVGFAGYDMPVQYEGVLAEHRWTREHAGLFDVSHMGQARIARPDAFQLLERVTPGRFTGLAGRQRYSLLLNAEGGILDDLMVAEPDAGGGAFLVVNASRKTEDFALIRSILPEPAALEVLEDRALVALQGPEAAEVLAAIVPAAPDLRFMDSTVIWDLVISRSGYTGEDGFEISVPASDAPELWRRLLADERVRPIGLGARDSLRLEAGMPLYGHDIDETTSPIEADLGFAVAKARREAADFPGAERIIRDLTTGPARVRVGLEVTGAPAREGAEVRTEAGEPVGRITSGGFSPSLGRPIAMAYVRPDCAAAGTQLNAVVRDRPQPAEVTTLPFVPHRYVRKP